MANQITNEDIEALIEKAYEPYVVRVESAT